MGTLQSGRRPVAKPRALGARVRRFESCRPDQLSAAADALAYEPRYKRRYRRNPEKYRAQSAEYVIRNAEKIKAKRRTPEFRAKRAAYMRMFKLCERIFDEWVFQTWSSAVAVRRSGPNPVAGTTRRPCALHATARSDRREEPRHAPTHGVQAPTAAACSSTVRRPLTTERKSA